MKTAVGPIDARTRGTTTRSASMAKRAGLKRGYKRGQKCHNRIARGSA